MHTSGARFSCQGEGGEYCTYTLSGPESLHHYSFAMSLSLSLLIQLTSVRQVQVSTLAEGLPLVAGRKPRYHVRSVDLTIATSKVISLV